MAHRTARGWLPQIRATYHAARFLADPTCVPAVVSLAEALAENGGLDAFARQISKSDAGRAALRERPRVGPIRPPGPSADPRTLRSRYFEFMGCNSLDAGVFPALQDRTDGEWLYAHLYETHDLWHVLTGFRSDVAGEVGLQGVYLAQLGLRTSYLLVTASLLRAAAGRASQQRRLLQALVDGWVLGTEARPLLGFPFADWLDRPLDDARAALHINPVT